MQTEKTKPFFVVGISLVVSFIFFSSLISIIMFSAKSCEEGEEISNDVFYELEKHLDARLKERDVKIQELKKRIEDIQNEIDAINKEVGQSVIERDQDQGCIDSAQSIDGIDYILRSSGCFGD